MWWNKKLNLTGAVLFRGTMAPRAEEFESLAKQDIAVEPVKSDADGWALKLRHRDWGEADLLCLNGAGVPPPELISYEWLSPAEKETAMQGQSAVVLRMQAPHGHVLRDCKVLLRYLRAVMGDDGVACMAFPMKVWTREALNDELSHNADLDVSGIFNLHVVADGESERDRKIWLHTHGLGEIDAYDFDILNPSREIAGHMGFELLRGIAFASLEKKATPNGTLTLMHPGPEFQLIPSEDFQDRADPRDAEIRSNDPGHNERRVVLCEPARRGWFSWLGGNRPKPCRALQRSIPDNGLIFFSNEATELMAQRARESYSLFCELAQEFDEFEFPALVKLGYQVDGGGPNDREHLWFKVHQTLAETVDATLANAPYHIERLKEGERGTHPVSLMTDWMVLTPAGPINPRSLTAARMLRAHKDEMRENVRKSKGEV